MPSLTLPDGRTLSYEVQGEGELLVCHPGGPGFSGSYLGELGGVARSRAIVALDPCGTGGSDPPRSADNYALDDYASDLGHLQDHLEAERIDLLGHSHGSLVALKYAASHPDRIRRLILVATGARFHEEQVEAMHVAMTSSSVASSLANCRSTLRTSMRTSRSSCAMHSSSPSTQPRCSTSTATSS